MKLFDNEFPSLCVNLASLIIRGLEGSAEPGLKLLVCVKDVGHEKIKQRPELTDIILERCPRENELVGGIVMFRKRNEQLAVPILEAMTFINDHVLPFNTSQIGKINLLPANELITDDEDMELSLTKFRFIELNALVWIALVPERKFSNNGK